jgi:hypothetical protein
MRGSRKGKVKPLVVVQLPGDDGRLEHYHRTEADSASAAHLREALDRIIEHPSTHRIGFKPKPTFKGHRPAKRGDEEAQIPGVVENIVEKALT